MTHGALICQECFSEADIGSTDDTAGTEFPSQTEMVCPNCGSKSFSI